MVTSLLQKDLKGVVGRAARVKEVQCLDLSPCRKNNQSLSGTICEQAHRCWAQEEVPAPLPSTLVLLLQLL